MKILEVSLGVGAASGGPVRSITGLARALSFIEDCEVVYFVHNPNGIERFDLGNVKVIRGHWNDCGNDFSSDFENALVAERPDLVHFHGIWHLTLHSDQAVCRKHGIPYLIAPRGSLDAWSMQQKWLKKKIAMMVFQKRDLDRAAALHVTAEMEATHCRNVGYEGKFILSPNGINLPKDLPTWKQREDGRRRMLFLSRMHPKKGVLELVDAWARLRQSNNRGIDQWRCELVYTLFDDAEREYEARVKSRVLGLGLADSFLFTGSLSDVDKWSAYRRANCFVLPTHTENFGIVIAEALYAGLPVITTTNAPWQGLVKNGCGWWIDLSQGNLQKALLDAISLSDAERTAMGEAGRKFVVDHYSWPMIAKNFAADCRKLIGGA